MDDEQAFQRTKQLCRTDLHETPDALRKRVGVDRTQWRRVFVMFLRAGGKFAPISEGGHIIACPNGGVATRGTADKHIAEISASFQELSLVLSKVPENALKDRILAFLVAEFKEQLSLIEVLGSLPKPSFGVKILDGHESYLARLEQACKDHTLSEEIKGIGEGTEQELLDAINEVKKT